MREILAIIIHFFCILICIVYYILNYIFQRVFLLWIFSGNIYLMNYVYTHVRAHARTQHTHTPYTPYTHICMYKSSFLF